MPNYTYVPTSGEGCEHCQNGVRVRHRMDQVVRCCVDCGGALRRSIREPQVQVGRSHRAGYQEYREDMARFPGDPEAFVNSPQQVAKLRDLRQKRDGWLLRDEDWGDMYNTMPKESLDEGPDLGVGGRELVQEAYEEALEDLGNE